MSGAPGTTAANDSTKAPAGVVIPPKDIRAIVEKTAGYVARNGIAFEDRIRENQKADAKFSFLNPADPYSPYYLWRLDEIRLGRGIDITTDQATSTGGAQKHDKPKGPPPPEEFHFSARMPNINAMDLEILQLSALYMAANGRQFMTSLMQREGRNPQFDFLRPQHSFHQYFQRLVDQFTDLMREESAEAQKKQARRLADLKANASNRLHLLDRAKSRAEYTKYVAKQKQDAVEAEEKEKIEFNSIDWADFVIVETVLFNQADDEADLPPPASLGDLQTASLEMKAQMSLAPVERRLEEAMPGRDDAYLDNGMGQQQVNGFASPMPYQQQPQIPQQQQYPPNMYPGMPPPPGMMPPPQAQYPAPFPPIHPQQQAQIPQYSPSPVGYSQMQPPPVPQAPPPGSGYTMGANEDENRAIAERAADSERAAAARSSVQQPGGAPMKIRNDYVPRAQAKRMAQQTSICPNCKQAIPTAELDEHIRIELLDPQWKEQRQKAESRQGFSHYHGTDLSSTLAKRPPASGNLAGEEERRKRLAMGGGR